MADIDLNHQRFWQLADDHLQRPGVERGTMMGSECLRVGGDFYAMIDRRNGQLLVKLPAERVLAAIEAGRGNAFKPARHVFKEWLAVPDYDRDHWTRWLDEAHLFVASQ